jgi:lipid II:glycine glycyltransferase (peptidoglycan interpeptide bridge formation enzyme)
VYHEPLSVAMMQSFGFDAVHGVGTVCSLDGGIDGVWSRMKGTCRTRIRKAQKMGLTAEVVSDGSIVDHFFRVYSDGLARKERAQAAGPAIPRHLLDHLVPADRVFSVCVKQGEAVIGAAFYPHDDRAMYFWDGASDQAYLELSPNELLHWTAIELAAARGIREFKMSGGFVPQPPNRFIEKFGGVSRQFIVYRKSFVPLLATARRAYRWLASLRSSRTDEVSAVLMGTLVFV